MSHGGVQVRTRQVQSFQIINRQNHPEIIQLVHFQEISLLCNSNNISVNIRLIELINKYVHTHLLQQTSPEDRLIEIW